MPFRKARQPLLQCPESPSMDWGDPINKALVGYWPLNEAGGLTAFDASGGGTHLRLQNATSRVIGSRTAGRSAYLNGTNQYFQGAFRHAPGPFITCCGWLVLNSYGSGDCLINLGSSGGGDVNANLVVYGSSTSVLWGNNSDDATYNLPFDITGRRVFLCGTQFQSQYAFYFNGRYLGARTGNNPGFIGDSTMIIGKRQDGFAQMNGSVQDIRVYNRALTPGEVLRLYQEPWAGVLPPRRRISSAAPGGSGALSGTASAAGGATGNLTGAGALIGTASAAGGATGNLTGAGAMTGSAVAVAGATGTLGSSTTLSGTASAAGGATGNLTGAGALIGTASAAGGATGALTGAGALIGTASAAGGATGTLTGAGSLTGSAVAVAGATGTLGSSATLSGTASAAGGATATLTGKGALIGSAVAVAGATATLTGFAGSASATAIVTGNLTGKGALIGSAVAVATASLSAVPQVPVGYPAMRTLALDAKTKAIYTALAADAARAKIMRVPGSGPILGVVAMAFSPNPFYGLPGVDQLYAFRADAGGANALLYQATSTGWVLIPYKNLIAFTAGGSTTPFDGDTLTQGGVTATVRRVMWQSGAWGGSAVGQFVIDAPVGGAFHSGAATTSSGATLTLSGPSVPITMAAGGRFEFEKCNFSGQLITRRIYGCDGVNPPFEFDGVTLAPIATGLSPNRPAHIRFHKNFLFLSQDASLFFSAVGQPFKWSAVDGAGEIATGDTVTGMITLPGSQTTATLGVYLHTNTAFLYGTDPSTFNFVTFNTGIGAVPFSIQNLFDTFFLDDLGVVTLKTTLNYGNFLPTTLTKNILPFIARERGNLVASSVSRERSQYRLFFKDGYALYSTILNQQYLGSGLVLMPDTITCTDSTKLIGDDEATYAGGSSGYVYQLDVGTSFDGAAIPAFITTAWDPVRSPRILKRFRAASIEVQGDSYAEISYGYQLGYNSDQLPQLPPTSATLNLGALPHWDSFVWDQFVWDGSGLTPTDVDQTGTAENIRVTISSSTNYTAPFTVNSVIHHYSPRRGMRV